MNGASIAPVVADSIGATTAGAPAEPTAAQAARFEQQLNQSPAAEPAHYGMPPAGPGTDFHAVFAYVGEASARLRVNLESTVTTPDLPGLPPELQEELHLQQQLNEGLRNMSNATLELEMIGKSVELAENMPKVLYQQG